LGISLGNIALIDTNSVDPEDARLGGVSHVLEGGPEVVSHLDGLVVAGYAVGRGRVAPCVGEGRKAEIVIVEGVGG
jgi:hypothetical protein